MSDISVVKEENCFGCGACYNCCPVSAISMQENHEGFLMPIIDATKCTNCGLCVKSCPAIGDKLQEDNESRFYVGWSKDKKNRNESSSGGAFTMFANWIFEQGGYVCGAAFDSNAKLKHVVVDNENDLQALKGSKYLQSDIGDVFKELKEKLESDNYVLFCGTPCQVAGLYKFLQKDYGKLYTLDLVCHGVPSQSCFDEFLEEKFGADASYENINFRDKRNGYYRPTFVASFNDDRDDYVEDFVEVDYLKAFSANVCLRKACSSCKYSCKDRVGDISLADLWTVKDKFPSLDFENGISTIITNNKKGEYLFEQIASGVEELKEATFKDVVQGCLVAPLPVHPNREKFFSLKDIPFSQKIKECLVTKNNVGILNYQDDNSNYGALFVAFSMKRAIEKLGYDAQNINYIREQMRDKSEIFENFRAEYLNLTKPFYNKEDLKELNSSIHTFITGGDQVFIGFNPTYTLSWVDGEKTISSYAASMGPFNENYYEQNQSRIFDLLSRFDKIAVRENSAVRILRKLGIHSDSYVDSVLLLEQEEYNHIIENDKNVKPRNEKYVACMLWDINQVKDLPFYEEFSKEYKFVDVMKDDNGDFVTFGQFLSNLKNADYVIANSFHGIVFSIIFQKQFIATRLGDMRDDRVITMFNKLGISLERFYCNIKDVQRNMLDKKIDYDKVNGKLAVEKNKGYAHLREVLEMQPVVKYKFDPLKSARKIKINILNKIPFLKIKRNRNKTKCSLFGFMPIFTYRHKDSKVYLFGFIPLFKVVG